MPESVRILLVVLSVPPSFALRLQLIYFCVILFRLFEVLGEQVVDLRFMAGKLNCIPDLLSRPSDIKIDRIGVGVKWTCDFARARANKRATVAVRPGRRESSTDGCCIAVEFHIDDV